MRRDTIAPPARMTPPAGWAPWVQDTDGAGGDFAEPSVEDGVPTRGGTCACPVCGLDLSSWTLPDRETHADACVARAFEGDATASHTRDEMVGRHDQPPFAETRAETHAETASPGDAIFPAMPSPGGASRARCACDAFLHRHGLSRYAPAFAREALFPSDLPSLTREDLRHVLGVRDERDAATFLAAAAPRAGGGGLAAREPFPFAAGVGPRGRPSAATSAPRSREDARLASLEQHDDEWTHLAIAISASAREAPSHGASAAVAVALGKPRARETAETGDGSVRETLAAPRGLRGNRDGDAASSPRAARVLRERRDVANEPERGRAANPRDAEAVVSSPPAPRERNDRVGSKTENGSVLEAARSLGRRSVPSSLWGAAGHGGRDREIPDWVLGGEKPRVG